MKKLLAVIVAALMLGSFAVTASAADLANYAKTLLLQNGQQAKQKAHRPLHTTSAELSLSDTSRSHGAKTFLLRLL